MQVSAAEFVAVIIALATGCVTAIALAWRWSRKFRDCEAALSETVKRLNLEERELATLKVAVNSNQVSKQDSFPEPIDYGPSRYIA